jgi:AcrR family transcriptional regulator
VWQAPPAWQGKMTSVALKRKATRSEGKAAPKPAAQGESGRSQSLSSPEPSETARPAEPPTRSARRAQRTRSRLEKAALSAFVEVGLGAATIEMITERADIGKGTFYQHFSTKEELLAFLVRGAVDRLLARIQKAVQGLPDLRSTIGAITSAHLDYFQTNREEFILFFQGHGAVNLVGAAPVELEASYLRYLEKLESIIKERLSAPPGDVSLRRWACAIGGFAVGYLSFALLGLAEENLRETYRPVRETLVNGLTALIERSLAAPAAPASGSPPSSPDGGASGPLSTTPPMPSTPP